MKRTIAFLLAISILTINPLVYKAEKSSSFENTIEETLYDTYAQEHKNAPDGCLFEKRGADFSSAAGNYKPAEEAVFSEASSASYSFDIKQAGLYYIGLEYVLTDESDFDAEISLKLNGKLPFDAADSLLLPRYWKDSEVKRTDLNGNETSPAQERYDGFCKEFFKDDTGVITAPYGFYFESGANSITLTFKKCNIKIKTVIVRSPNLPKAYTVPTDAAELNAEQIVIEAEKAFIKSSRSIVGKSDNSSAVVSPSDPVKQLVNYIGGSNWKAPNDTIEWQFNVEQAGYYKLAFSYKQSDVLNGCVYRILKIDGDIPFAEAEKVKFDYSRSWKSAGFETEDGKPYLIYLEKGLHTLTLSVTLGEYAAVYKSLQNISSELRGLYMSIVMITGETPDSNRDYDLYNQIPDFEAKLKSYYEQINAVVDNMRRLNGQETNSFIAILVNTARVINNMIENIYKAEDYLSDFYSNYSSMSSSISEMCDSPLSLDRIYIAPANAEFDFVSKSFLGKMMFGIKRFIVSFSSNYDQPVADSSYDREITLWVNWGRDQSSALNSLIQSSFTPDNKIRVNLRITSASIINGMLSGNAPDIQLYCGRSDPVNYAMRGAVYDLTQFSDFDGISARFSDSAMVPYTYKGGVYALPDLQSFYVMFYRKDVLSSLGISVPQTWDDFLAAATVLRMNNMDTWVPGAGGTDMFNAFLLQNGGSLYNDELNECLLNSPVSLSAFSAWTDLYVKYKLPVSLSFYNRFRVGITPLGIETYTMYSQIKELAPEIDKKWGIALVPGTKREDGTVDRTVAATGSGCVILNTSKDKKAAWEFLKWWTSADTQVSYNSETESVLGKISRIATSNIEAFGRFGWDSDDLKILNQQRSYVKEIPEIPGSYYVARSLKQAFWSVYNNGENFKDAMLKWSDEANDEISRKIAQYE